MVSVATGLGKFSDWNVVNPMVWEQQIDQATLPDDGRFSG
jgi:hypothetical protein